MPDRPALSVVDEQPRHGEVPVVPFAHVLDGMRTGWRQGEHVVLVGPTGAGKTEVVTHIQGVRGHTMFLATKREDPTVDLLEDQGYRRMDYPQNWAPRVIIEPPFPRDVRAMMGAQAEVFRRALLEAYQATRWCVILDEVRYLTQTLRLGPEVVTLLLQGRSLKISVVCCTQRPRWAPQEVYDQATHAFFWQATDLEDVRRLVDLGGHVDRPLLLQTVQQLDRHDFVYVNTRTGHMVRSNSRR